MKAYQVILLIMVLAFFFAFISIFFVFSHIHQFSKRMKRRLRAMDILLSEKANHLIALYEALKESGIEISEGDYAYIKKLIELRFDKSTSESVSANKAAVDEARKRFSFLAVTNKEIANHPEFKVCHNALEDLESGFRHCVVLYNSDLIGFNYWIDIPGTRLLVYLFHIEKAKMIN